jgi:hypothetical protein
MIEEIAMSAERRKIEDKLDRELENTFPASDPPSIIQPRHREQDAERKSAPSKR